MEFFDAIERFIPFIFLIWFIFNALFGRGRAIRKQREQMARQQQEAKQRRAQEQRQAQMQREAATAQSAGWPAAYEEDTDELEVSQEDYKAQQQAPHPHEQLLRDVFESIFGEQLPQPQRPAPRPVRPLPRPSMEEAKDAVVAEQRKTLQPTPPLQVEELDAARLPKVKPATGASAVRDAFILRTILDGPKAVGTQRRKL